MEAQSVHVAPRGLWEVVSAGPAALWICLGSPASPLREPQSSHVRSLCGVSFSCPPKPVWGVGDMAAGPGRPTEQTPSA